MGRPASAGPSSRYQFGHSDDQTWVTTMDGGLTVDGHLLGTRGWVRIGATARGWKDHEDGHPLGVHGPEAALDRRNWQRRTRTGPT